jgi:hypothetical protein
MLNAIIHCKKVKENLVSDIPAGDGKIANLFLQCMSRGGIRIERGWLKGSSHK